MTQDQPLLQALHRVSSGGGAARFPDRREPRWHWAGARAPAQWPRALGPWLLDQGSLTAALKARSRGRFQVQVLSQGLARPYHSETRTLAMASGRWALVREVVLWGCDEPWVFARSLLPLSSLKGRLRQLRLLDNRPLGGFLFRQPDLEREPLEVAELSPRCRYVPDFLQDGEPVWGRRSVFRLDHRPLLVSEVFLPKFVQRLSS